MIVSVSAAHAHSPGTADALLRELSLSKTSALETFSSSFPDMVGKAYRVSLAHPFATQWGPAEFNLEVVAVCR